MSAASRNSNCRRIRAPTKRTQTHKLTHTDRGRLLLQLFARLSLQQYRLDERFNPSSAGARRERSAEKKRKWSWKEEKREEGLEEPAGSRAMPRARARQPARRPAGRPTDARLAGWPAFTMASPIAAEARHMHAHAAAAARVFRLAASSSGRRINPSIWSRVEFGLV